MAFPILYAQIKRMLINVALDVSTARDIVRRAGLLLGDAETVPTTGERTIGLLLVADGEEQVPTGGDTPVVYSTQLANGDEYTFTPGDSSWIVPTEGLYRATATLVIGTPSDEGIFGHAHIGLTNRAVMQHYHYVPSTTTSPPERIVLAGSGTIYLGAGEEASHVFYTAAGSGEPGNILQDASASRLYVEKVL